MLNNIVIVLVETSHPGNIGASARAMKNMGITDLRLVNPRHFPSDEALSRAAGAEDILQQTRIFDDLTSAIVDCTLIVGTTARNRSLEWPQHSIDNAATMLTNQTQQKVAILFGRESSGLTNQELQYCNYQITIPTHSEYSSLNLAAAVQVICYELFKAGQGQKAPVSQQEQLATKLEVEGFYQHLEQIAINLHYLDPAKPGQLMPRLRRLYNRANLTTVEVNILRGFLSAIENKVKK